MGYIDAIQQPIERSKDKLIVSNRALQNAKALLEEALRYNPKCSNHRQNYNIVTTALRVQPSTIEPYEKSQLEDGELVAPSFGISTPEESSVLFDSVLPDNMAALTDEWNNFEEVILMLDASGSMRTMVPNTNRSRFEQGKQVANYFLDHFATKVKIGLVAVAGECGFAPKLSSSTLQNRTDLSNLMQDVKADGHTPINDALKLVPNLFQTNAQNKAVIFITDGIDSCDPRLTCELTASLGANGISVHIINLESIVSPEEYENYLCMTVSSGGMLRYINTSNQIELYDQFDLEDYLLLPKLETPKSKPDRQSVASL
ncbi:MAG: VWA domain-containing protein [Saprospiraceae bacterium]|nr:VWA domain-containing protein [Saprospiraceae bacterium]